MSFDSEENCDQAMQMLEGVCIGEFTLAPTKYSSQLPKNRITPPLSFQSTDRDLEYSRKIIAKFDEECGITDNELIKEGDKEGKSLPPTKQLDL